MARDEAPPFGRGETFFQNATPSTTDGINLEGKVYEFEDLDYSQQGAKPARSGRYVQCMIVRNVAAAALLPKRLVTLKKSGVNYLGQVDGYATITADRAYPVDEFLPAAGVAVNDLFWIVISGPALCLTDIAAVDSVSVGDVLVSLTAATSGATTAGRVDAQDLTGATAPLGNQIQNSIGRALSAKTSANTNSDILVEIAKW